MEINASKEENVPFLLIIEVDILLKKPSNEVEELLLNMTCMVQKYLPSHDSL
jgi:hypothetical protein